MVFNRMYMYTTALLVTNPMVLSCADKLTDVDLVVLGMWKFLRVIDISGEMLKLPGFEKDKIYLALVEVYFMCQVLGYLHTNPSE